MTSPKAAIAVLLCLTAAPAAAFTQTKFATPEAARQRCPRGIVVWLSMPNNVFYPAGARAYGATPHGAYMCEQDAVAQGARAARR